MDATQLVPAAAVKAKERERVCRGVEGHSDGFSWYFGDVQLPRTAESGRIPTL